MFAGEGAFASNDLGEHTSENSDDWDKHGSFLALMEFKGWSFIYLDNWTKLNCIENDMQKGRKDGGNHCCFQSNLCCVEVLRTHLTLHLHLSHPLSHLSCHGRGHP
jgi:hypothetical protein